MVEPARLPAVLATDLTIRYRQRGPVAASRAIDGVSFELPRGEIVAVVGETGSGKSTLARVLAGEGDLEMPLSPRIVGGELSVLGIPLRRVSDRRRARVRSRIGYLSQEAGQHLQPHLTVGETIAEPIFQRNRKFSQIKAGIVVATLVDAVRLPLMTMNKYPYELSAGQKQRVAIARALVLEPELLIADDPTSGVDVVARPAIIDIIHELQSEFDFSAFVVTTDIDEVERLSRNLLVMYRGAIVGRGDIDDVLGNPQNEFVAQLAETRGLGSLAESAHVNIS
jgi:peptide/nickel transport system ATP-binding protein